MSTAIDRKKFFAPLDDPLCTLRGRLEEAAERLYLNVRDSFPAERAAEAERVARQFVSDAHDLLCRDDRHSAEKLIGEFAQSMRVLSQPRVPTKDEQIERIAPVLVGRDGWAGIEIDLLRDTLRDGERITGYDRFKVATDQRTITRLSLRDRRPINWTNLRSWEDQFPPIE